MKRFGKFSKAITQNLMEIQPINIIYNPYKQKCLDEMSMHETVIIITHGGPEEIYHKYDFKNKQHQVLLNKENISLLEGKKIISISCATGRIFGKEAWETGKCKVFLGFHSKIHFDKKNKSEVTKSYRNFIGSCYKDVFGFVIEQSILNNWSFDKIKTVLGIELRNTVISRALSLRNERPQHYVNIGLDQAIFAVTNLSNNIVIYGDAREKII
ncbi:hypothetical protein MHB56_11350 [Paenibacillus sp. FSL H8-0315]